MKNTIFALSAMSMAAGAVAFAGPAYANNKALDHALKSRPELSMFYNALINTGVINELHADQPYTVFAPTNDAFAQYPQNKYICLYNTTPDCTAQLAKVLRNHIVAGEKHLNNMSTPGNEGDVDSLFSINNQHIVASEPSKGTYMVGGRKVINANQLLGGELYEIDGIIATGNDLSKLETRPLIIVSEPSPSPLPVKVEVTSTSQATTPIPH